MLPRPVVQGKGVWIRNFEWTGADSQAMRHQDGCGLSCLGVLQVTWENQTFLGAADLRFFKVHEANYAPRLQNFPLVQCFPLHFPQLLAVPISSFYMWELRHQSSSLYLMLNSHQVKQTLSTAGFVHSPQPWAPVNIQNRFSHTVLFKDQVIFFNDTICRSKPRTLQYLHECSFDKKSQIQTCKSVLVGKSHKERNQW